VPDKLTIEYFKTNLLSDHLPIMATIETKQEGNTKNTFICFSNNLSIQGSRGLKKINKDVWKEELSFEEKEIVHYLLLKTVVGVLSRIKPKISMKTSFGTSLNEDFIKNKYKEIYKEMYRKVAEILNKVKYKKIKTDELDLVNLNNNIQKLTTDMKEKNTTRNFTLLPVLETKKDSRTQISKGGGKKKRTKKGSKKKKRTIKGSKRKRTRRNPTGRTAH